MFAFSMKQSFLFTLLIGLTSFISLVAGVGCANIIPPQGGPKDTLAPRLLKVVPEDSSTNFRGRTITLTFDEFIELQNPAQNILITPTLPTNNQKIEGYLRTLTVRFVDSLEANTTYTLTFGNAIRDVNEGNVLPGFTYTFSTGPQLDSLTLSGNVVLAQSGGIDTALIVILHRNLDDSAVVKDRPRYLTRVDRSGNFTFRNLPAGTFALYALGDVAGRRYTSKSALFAFADTAIVVRPNTPPVTLYAYQEISKPTSTTSASTGNASDKRLRFSTNLSGSTQDLLDSFELRFEQPVRLLDTNLIRLRRDSTFAPVSYTTRLDSSRKKLTFQTAWLDNTTYHLILEKDFAEDSVGRRLLKSDTLDFTTRKRGDYGSFQVRLRNVEASRNPVFQLLRNGAIVYSAPVQNNRVAQPLFMPGDYEIQILYDRNGNGKWDPGQFFGAKRQPELVRPVERKLTIKAGQAADVEISL
jgi:uncharacterized protein (DUF2141 family)